MPLIPEGQMGLRQGSTICQKHELQNLSVLLFSSLLLTQVWPFHPENQKFHHYF